ncbi:11082_t:CDS:2, partial [Acaulospora morrowiae]
ENTLRVWEIPSKTHINKDHADGVGFMTNADKFQIVYVEDSKPVSNQDKEIANSEKISYQLRLHLYYLDYCGNFRLNEVDNANLPRDFSLLVQNVIKSFDDARSEETLPALICEFPSSTR